MFPHQSAGQERSASGGYGENHIGIVAGMTRHAGCCEWIKMDEKGIPKKEVTARSQTS